MRSRSVALLLGSALSLACGEDASSDDNVTRASNGGSSGAASSNGGTSPNGGTSAAGTGGLGGTNEEGGLGGASGTGMSGTAGGGPGGLAGAGTGATGGAGSGGTGGSVEWTCQASDAVCICGPVTNPNVDDCGSDWSCCVDYVSVIDEVEREVCACDEASAADCTERVTSLYRGRREAACPP